MNTTAPIPFRYALILNPTEVAATSIGNSFSLFRRTASRLLGNMALADRDGVKVFATAVLRDVVREIEAGESSSGISLFEWRIDNVKLLTRPFSLGGRAAGPIWARLGCQDRLLLVGESFPTDGTAVPAAPINISSIRTPKIDLFEGHEDPIPPVVSPSADCPKEKPDSRCVDEGLETYDDAIAFDQIMRQARELARSFIPSKIASENMAREILLRIGELAIKKHFPQTPGSKNILRKTMVEKFISEPIESEEDFYELMPQAMISSTDKDQIEIYLPIIIQILKGID